MELDESSYKHSSQLGRILGFTFFIYDYDMICYTKTVFLPSLY